MTKDKLDFWHKALGIIASLIKIIGAIIAVGGVFLVGNLIQKNNAPPSENQAKMEAPETSRSSEILAQSHDNEGIPGVSLLSEVTPQTPNKTEASRIPSAFEMTRNNLADRSGATSAFEKTITIQNDMLQKALKLIEESESRKHQSEKPTDPSDPKLALENVITAQKAWKLIEELKHQKQQGDNANLHDAVMVLAKMDKLRSANLSRLNLSGIDLTDIDLSNADFSHSILDHANFSLSNLTNANFSSASLERASFVRTLIVDTKFTGAEVRQAYFTNATILGADFRYADFMANRTWFQTIFDKDDIEHICFSEDVDLEYLRDVTEIDEEKNDTACFFSDKPMRWDLIEERQETLASSKWRLWRDELCSFHGPSLDEHICYGEKVHF